MIQKKLLFRLKYFLFILIISFGVSAQTKRVVGKFIGDSLYVGKPIYYSLTYLHPSNEDVFFPEISYQIPPFEIIDRISFPTRTENDISLDSIVYTLITFDISPFHELALPVFSRKVNGDSTAIFSDIDRVYTHTFLSNSANLRKISLRKYNEGYTLPKDFNLFILMRLGLTITLIGALIYIILGKWLRIQYHLFLFSRKNKIFINSFKKQTKEFTNQDNIAKSLVLWKEYMEWLEKKPYTSFTTKEIFQEIPNQRLLDALQEIDSSIYGGNKSNHIPFALSILLSTTQEKYKEQYILFLDWLKQNK